MIEKMKKIESLETKRLVLREITEEDTLQIVRWRSVPKVYQYFLSPKPITEKEHLNWYINCYKKDFNRIDFIAVEKESGKESGVFSIKRTFDNMQCSEIGYLLDKNAQGKGYAQEGIKRLMIFARDEWECQKAVFYIHENNRASRALADKLGYIERKREGEFMVYSIELEKTGGGYKV